jgi:hypothetical protein
LNRLKQKRVSNNFRLKPISVTIRVLSRESRKPEYIRHLKIQLLMKWI